MKSLGFLFATGHGSNGRSVGVGEAIGQGPFRPVLTIWFPVESFRFFLPYL